MLNPKQTKKVRQHLRNNATQWERRLWDDVRGRRLLGYKVRRQYGVDNYVLDFYCPELMLAIEIDGPTHFTDEGKSRDKIRDSKLKDMDIKVIRIPVSDLDEDYDGVCTFLEHEFVKRAEEGTN